MHLHQHEAERNHPNGAAATFDRKVPYSIEAEQALLGAILVRNDALDRVSGFLEPQHFFDPLHAQIYDTAASMIADGKSVTPITLAPLFEAAEPIDVDLTVPQYLGRLAVKATTIINARDYGRTIVDLYTRRQLIMIGESVVEAAYSKPDFPPKAQIEEAEVRLFSLGETSKRAGHAEPFKDASDEAVTQADEAYKAEGGVCGLRTYLADLDNKLGGLQPGDLIIVAGRPSMGKTALAINNFAFRNALAYQQTKGDAGAIVGVFSMEMSSAQLALRILAEQSEIPSEKIRRGMIGEIEFKKFILVSERYAPLPLYIDESGGLTIAQLAARARRMKRQHDIGLLVVDYLQLMQGSKRNNRVEDVSEITTGLKALAKDLAVPVVALSQLSRNVEHRSDKRPQLSDLRESGSIEQDADVVLFVYREEYYVERDRPPEDDPEKYGDWMTRMRSCTGKAEIIIGKQRHGPTGKVEAMFDGPLTRFANLARQSFIGSAAS